MAATLVKGSVYQVQFQFSRDRANLLNDSNHARKTCITFLCVLGGILLTLCLLWIMLVIYASPLAEVEVVGISNVLGTQKELIFNLQVRAK